MPDLVHGDVTVRLPDNLPLPAEAGKLSPEEVARVPKARRGLGAACDSAAAALEVGGGFVAPRDVTPESLRKAGRKAEQIDEVIASVEFLLGTLKQANLLLDADAWEQLRKLNDQVRAQGKSDPEIARLFTPLTDYMRTR